MPTILITYLVLRSNYVEDFRIYTFAVEIHLAAPLRPCLYVEDVKIHFHLPSCQISRPIPNRPGPRDATHNTIKKIPVTINDVTYATFLAGACSFFNYYFLLTCMYGLYVVHDISLIKVNQEM